MDRNSSSTSNEAIRWKWEKLEAEEQRLQQEKQQVSEEWVSLERKHIAHEAKRTAFEQKLAEESLVFLPLDEEVKINVGGQLFTSTVKVWTRDRFSILARLCIPSPPLTKDTTDAFFFDRDWYIFRYIFLFLRDKTLPDSLETLRELYYEASYYRLSLLRHAIEARLVNDEEELKVEDLQHKILPKSLSRTTASSKSNNKNNYPLWSDEVSSSSSSRSKVKQDKQVLKSNSNSVLPPQFVDQSLPDPYGFVSDKKYIY